MTARPRILLVIAGLTNGGAERQMALLARGLDRERFDVGLLIFGRESRIHYRDVFDRPLWFRALEISGKGPSPSLLWSLFRGIRGAVRAFRPDLIHTSLNVANHAVRATAVLSGWRMPLVTSVRADFRTAYRRSERLAERCLAPWSRRIVTNVEPVRRDLIAALPLPPGRVVTIPNGLDPRFAPGPPGDLPAGWPADGPVALAVGHFTPVKNHLGLIRALAALAAEERLGVWRFVLVGRGPLEGDIRAAVAAGGLGGRVVLLPPQADPLPLYRAAALLVLPSLHEGLPNVALEAQAAGCPAAIAAAANRSGAVDPDSGFVLDGDLAQALGRVLALPADRLRACGTAAGGRVRDCFAAERMVRETETLYMTCLKAGTE